MSEMIFHFPEIKGSFCKVNFSKNNVKIWKSFKIQIKDDDLDARIAQHLPPLSADLIDLGTAIFVSDWLSNRRLHEEPSLIEIRLPVRNRKLFTKESILKKLKYLLSWFTEDHWSFEFIDRQSKRDIESQSVLSANTHKNIEIALWSGGLDSLAGLYMRFKQNPQINFCLVGTGFNKKIVGKQKLILNALIESSEIQASLRQIPYYLEGTSSKPNHPYMRSRGLTFMFMGAAVCLAMEHPMLHIYENGIGAFNLPYRKSEVGLDHTRSVHPVSLIKISQFLSDLIGKEFTVKNPFVFSTKAQMCKPIINDGLKDIVFDTTTCDSSHRSSPAQCGYCSSCLLRRQSILANDTEDKSGYV